MNVSDKTFENIKQSACKVWEKYSDEFGYRSGKLDRIKDLENIRDNREFILAMFDLDNLASAISYMSEEAREEIRPYMERNGYGFLFPMIS